MAVVSVANSHIFCREMFNNKDENHHQQQQQQQQWWWSTSSGNNTCVCLVNGAAGYYWSESVAKREGRRKQSRRRRGASAEAFWPGAAKPTAVEMEAITSTEHFDQILQQSSEHNKAIIVDWMANWCRKCIYLKPKLEKLAAEYDTNLKFYYVDVNNVSQALVKRGNISKMPTIQLWKDGEMKEEVIGGHKAWLVVDEVREMIHKYI